MGAGIGAGAVAGGVVALAMNFFGIGAGPDQGLVDGLAAVQSDVSAVQSDVSAVQATAGEVQSQAATLADQLGGLAGIADQIAANQASIASSATSLEALQAQVADLAAQPSAIATDGDGAVDLDATLAQFRGDIEASIDGKIAAAGDALGVQFADTSSAQVAEAAAALEGKIADVQASLPDLAPLEQAIADVRAAMPDLAPVNGEIGGLAAALAALEAASQAAQADLAGRADTLGQDLSATQEQVAAVADQVAVLGQAEQRVVGTALAVFDLDAALQSGGSPNQAIDMLQKLAGDDAEMNNALAILQDGPIKTVGALGAELSGLASAISTDTSFGDDVAGQVANNLSSLFSVKQVDAPEDPRLAAHKSALDAFAAGDVAGAVSAVQSLADAGVDGAAGWVADAGRYLTAHDVMESLKSLSRRLLANAG